MNLSLSFPLKTKFLDERLTVPPPEQSTKTSVMLCMMLEELSMMKNSKFVQTQAWVYLWLIVKLTCLLAATLSITIETADPRLGVTPQSVELSFNSSDMAYPLTQRTITIAPGFMYNLHCVKSGGVLDNNTWYSETGAVTLNTSQSVYSQSPNNSTWTLVFTNFSSNDTGRYSCSYSGEALQLTILSGKWKLLYQCTNVWLG